MRIVAIGLLVVLLVLLSAVWSGLNIALMSLNIGDLERKAKLGNASARKVLPLRRNSHLSLASIIIANVAVISATSLVLSRFFNGWLAGAVSTLLIVVFGEILPQALFARYALHFTARFALPLRLIIFITYPLSKPLQIMLDRLLGQEQRQLHSRHELGIMLGEHLKAKNNSELDEGEVEIMQGALQLSEKRVRDIMTKLRDVYWLQPDTTIDGAKIDEIKARGRSRIPIFNRQCTTSYGLLLMKDLVDLNFDDHPERISDLPLYPAQVVGSMTALDTLLRKFISGHSHLLPVEQNDKIIGIVTIEDLLEEIVQHEITDEADNARKR